VGRPECLGAEPAKRGRVSAPAYRGGPAGLAERVAREVPMWRDLIQRAGIPMEG
jgi:hypothetical protein